MWEGEEFADLRDALREVLVNDPLKFHDARRAAAQPVAEAPAKKLRTLKQHSSFDDFERAMAKATAPGSHTPETRATFKIRAEKQWQDYFEGDLIPLQDDPYEWWRCQDHKKMGLVLQPSEHTLLYPLPMQTLSAFIQCAAKSSATCAPPWLRRLTRNGLDGRWTWRC